MAFADIHLMTQTLLYFCTFLAGFVVCIPVGVTNIYFDGKCILYGNFKWANSTSFVMMSSDHLNCNFPIYLNVFACIFYSLGLGIYNAYAVYKSRAEPTIASQMWVMPFILTNSLVCFAILISSCMISIGFKEFCTGLTKGSLYKTCSAAQYTDWKDINSGDMFNTKNYYSLLAVAQVASWITFLLWLAQVGLGILRFVRNRRLRSQNMQNDKDKIASVEPTA